ncbi:spore germination protein [Paenibacillus sp. V4I3]|uniref:Ger(x)C family spore germination protein n=1 Tax=unclassified Paenibacillus TaxID=185978 RepID=UPI00277E4B32|nr:MULTISPECIES: Ger(x)C family spore germination protein [unclassified Paenibacillus]MDQ0874845.1 spore germination protein [Paenibacillus sp. V4I3]MDQ0889403.1 spore germination protein [Paenibacillus sp. V4I9]
MRSWVMVVVLLCLTGCVEQNRIEKLGMSDAVAMDTVYEENGKPSETEVSIAISIPSAGTLDKQQADILQTIAESPKDGRSKLSRKIDKVLVSGQLRSMVFGKDLAKQGIWKELDSYRRDYTVGEKLKIVVVNGSAVDMLTHKYAQIRSVGNHIDQLLTQEAKIHEVPDVSLYSFVRDYYDDGTDPIAPMLVVNGDNVEIDGIALFKKDRYMGKISAEQTVMFSILNKSLKMGEFDITFMDRSSGQKESAMISSIASKREVIVNKQERARTVPQVVIRIRLSGIILEYTGKSTFKKAEEQKNLDQDLSEAIREQLQTIVSHVQRSGGDNLGIGTYVRNSMSYEKWNNLNWKSIYPRADIRVEVDTTIRDYGMIR